MRTYEYRCHYCDYLFEHVGSEKDDTPICPICGGETIRIQALFETDDRPNNKAIQETFLSPEIMGEIP